MKIVFTDNVIRENDEKIILIGLIGILEALKSGGLSIDEAEKLLFSPHIVTKLRMKKCNEKIIDILERGCELEDLASLMPNELLKAIDELKKMALELMKNYVSLTFWFE